MVASVTGAAIVADPLAVSVNVRSLGVPRCIFKVLCLSGSVLRLSGRSMRRRLRRAVCRNIMLPAYGAPVLPTPFVVMLSPSRDQKYQQNHKNST